MLEDDVLQQNQQQIGASNNAYRHIKIAVNDDSLSSWFMGILRANALRDNPYLLEVSIADQDYSIDQMKSGSALAAISIDKEPVQGFESIYLGTHVYRASAFTGLHEKILPRWRHHRGVGHGAIAAIQLP